MVERWLPTEVWKYVVAFMDAEVYRVLICKQHGVSREFYQVVKRYLTAMRLVRNPTPVCTGIWMDTRGSHCAPIRSIACECTLQ